MNQENRHCLDCDWRGDDSELVNAGCFGEDYYVGGECCPACGSDNVAEVTDETP